MSRSRRKHPISGMTMSESEKNDKRIWHRAWRRVTNQKLKHDPEDYEDVHYREVSDTWIMSKDGRQIVDPNEFPEVLRK